MASPADARAAQPTRFWRACFVLVSLGLGLWIFYTDFSAYHGRFRDLIHELTGLSNLLAAIVLLLGGALMIRGRRLPNHVYFAITMVLILVAGNSLAFGLNMSGFYAYLHLYNPLAYLGFWLIFIDHRGDRIGELLGAAFIIPVGYLVVVLVAFDGYYPFLSKALYGPGTVLAYIGVTSAGIACLAVGLVWVDRALRPKRPAADIDQATG